MLKIRLYLISLIFLLPASVVLSTLYADAATYTYDSLSRITMADYENGFIEEYTYDAAGNRLMITVTSKWIRGDGYTSPAPGAKAEISVEIRASSPGTGHFTYNYTQAGIALSSRSIRSLIIEDNTVVITGECIVNGLSGYSYMVKLTDTPDTVEIKIYNPDGTLYFSTSNDMLVSGDLSIGIEPPDHQLITTTVPSDGGTISPDCSSGCLYESGTSVTITANENSGYGFINWNGCASAANNICIITMDNPTTVTAFFGPCDAPVRLVRTDPIYFSSLQNAYDASQDGDTINIQEAVFYGDIQIDRDISITMRGGYDCTYSNNSGRTTLEGSMTISSGTVTIEGLVIE